MAQAMQQVEEVRLRMQRASERIELDGTPAEGTLVKKKTKKKSKKQAGTGALGAPDETTSELTAVKKKKKRKDPEKRARENEPPSALQ